MTYTDPKPLLSLDRAGAEPRVVVSLLEVADEARGGRDPLQCFCYVTGTHVRLHRAAARELAEGLLAALDGLDALDRLEGRDG